MRRRPIDARAAVIEGRDPVVLVTGAGGFVGSYLCRELARRGWSVRGLVRHPARRGRAPAGVPLFQGDLPDRIDPAAFEGAAVVVHCAYSIRPSSTLAEVRRSNELGTERVLAHARKAGCRFVFVSSTGAWEGARSYYGRSKLAIERTLDPSRDLVVRPGLVLGDGGLFERIRRSLQRFGVMPVFGGGHQRVQTVHVEDLCTAIGLAIEKGLVGRYVVAEPDGLELRDLFEEVARRVRRRWLLVPLPAAPLVVALRALESLGLHLPLSSENVLGALGLRAEPSAGDLRDIGVDVRSATESLDDVLGEPTA